MIWNLNLLVIVFTNSMWGKAMGGEWIDLLGLVSTNRNYYVRSYYQLCEKFHCQIFNMNGDEECKGFKNWLYILGQQHKIKS